MAAVCFVTGLMAGVPLQHMRLDSYRLVLHSC